MLFYLAGFSCPDSAYALNSCACYMFQPCFHHKKALKRIRQFLKATRDKGLVLKPSGQLEVDFYLEADFAQLYSYESNSDSACA
ncbi:hypothetical protein ACHAW6_001403 [Cyclotella cf. meneghiniana]